MDPRDCAVIDRHYPRLQQCLEPSKLLRYLETVGVLDEDDVETICEKKRERSREVQVATFVDIIKRRESGFMYLLQALLKSKVQDYLARELLKDDVYNEEEISAILSELENDLDETQSLKLRLIEEEKRHRTTKKELDEMKRNSIVFSDSSSSGLYPDYDSNLSDGEESEYTIFSPREQLDNVASGDEDNSPLNDDQTQGELQNAGPLLAKTEDFEWEDEDGWRKFGSVDSLDTLSGKKVKNGLFNSLWKSSSLGRLNERRQDSGMAKRSSEKSLKQKMNSPGSLNRGKKNKKQLESLEDKVVILEKQLQDEKRRRENSEHEVAQLQVEKEGLYLELEDTRDQLRESQLNLFYEGDDYEEELCFEQGGNDNESTGFCGEPNQLAVPLERKHRFPSTDSEITAARCGSPGLNKLQSQTEHLRRTRLTASWRSLNAQFYELDEYDDEITVELDPSNILDTLRRLKTHTNALYNDVLNERDELRYLKKRTSRLESS